MIQATETVKLLAGIGEPLVGRLLLVDALTMQFRTVKLRKDPRCPACGTREITQARRLRAVLRDPRRRGGRTVAVPALTPSDLAARLKRGDDLDLIDVREPHEWDICRIEGARLAPLSSFAESLRTLDSARDVVLYCKSGMRSAKAARQLQTAGFKRVWNLAGGILRWSEEIDPTVPRY